MIEQEHLDYIAVRLKGHRVFHATMDELRALAEQVIGLYYEALNEVLIRRTPRVEFNTVHLRALGRARTTMWLNQGQYGN